MKCRKEDSISGWRIPYGPGTHQCASFYLHGRICPCQPGLSCFPGQPAKCRAISAETPCLQPNNRREEWSTGISSLPHHEKERNICQKRRLQTKQATPKRAAADNLRRRSRFYQSLIDAPILKSGKKTRYRHLPSTVIIFITQEDLFGKDLAMYTFREWCQEVPKLPLDDGTCKIFLNMTSKRGRAELVSLLQYMKNSNLNNAEISVKDQRILDLDKVVREVKESEEWEDVKMNILEIGLERGKELGILQGIEQGRLKTLVQNVESAMKNFNVTLPQACAGLEISVAEYKKAKEQISSWE